MTISLGQNPWVLIILTFFELLFIIIPALIAAQIEHTSIKTELNEMGFQKTKISKLNFILEIFVGGAVGFTLYIVGGFIYLLNRILIQTIFGVRFFEAGKSGGISTRPIQPDIIQILIILLQQLLIIAISEEAFFRGFLIKKLDNKIPLSLSIIISSILFALYHSPPFLVPISTIISSFGFYFTFGILLSILFMMYDTSLISVIICHAFYNILVILF
ncbi:MAG: CPBP family intramembrane metalloprotease [Promethearchaeota archaeon]|nr:MAG: CPBP family intramembrane metalloprotease [Candidatus Lokiarchaeota archaeon]